VVRFGKIGEEAHVLLSLTLSFFFNCNNTHESMRLRDVVRYDISIYFKLKKMTSLSLISEVSHVG
jgi:hypothetical protein